MPGRCGLHLGGGVGPQSTLARRVPSTWLSSPRPSFSGGRCSEAGRPWSCWVRWSLYVLCCLRWCASNGGEGAWRHFRHLGERFRVRAASSAPVCANDPDEASRRRGIPWDGVRPMLRFMKRREPDWVAYGTSAAGRVVLGRAADPNVCPNCGRAVDAEDVVHSRSIGDQPSEIVRCKPSDCAVSLARMVRADGSRGAWSAVVATDGE
jgi:hypothetical protein